MSETRDLAEAKSTRGPEGDHHGKAVSTSPARGAGQQDRADLAAVLPMTAEVKDGHLWIGGVDTVELAREAGTALYVMDEATIRHQLSEYVKWTHVPLEGRRRRLRRQGVHVARDGQARRRGGLLPRRLERRRARLRAARRLPDGAHLRARQQQDAGRARRVPRRRRRPHRRRQLRGDGAPLGDGEPSAASRSGSCSASRRASRPTRTTSS